MTHLPFIAGAYVLGVAIPLVFGLSAWQRAAAARRKLAAIDPRQAREARQ
jgi:type IV secretory pathway TrbD component